MIKTIRFGSREQKLICWFKELQALKQRDISYVISKAVEYHMLTGRYLQIAKINLNENAVSLPVRFTSPKKDLLLIGVVNTQIIYRTT